MSVRNWQSVRTVLEALILAGIIWLIRSASLQGESIIRLQTQFETEQASNAALVAAVPALTRQVDRIEVRVDGNERRISDIEAHKK